MQDFALDIDQSFEPELPGKRDRVLVLTISGVTVLMWMTTPLHGIHVAAISLIPIVGLTMTQVLGAVQVRGLPWDTLMLVAGGLALGASVVDTGLAERLATWLEFLTLLGWDPLVFGALALVTVTLSNFMSNTATVSLILPVAIALMPGRELEMCLILGLSGSCALLLPVSTPPNAIAFSTGEIQTKDLRPGGILIGLLGPARDHCLGATDDAIAGVGVGCPVLWCGAESCGADYPIRTRSGHPWALGNLLPANYGPDGVIRPAGLYAAPRSDDPPSPNGASFHNA